MTRRDRLTVAVVTLVLGDTEVPVGRVVGRDPDLAVVDSLARLQLAARRAGCSIRLRAVRPRLAELIDLAGLTDLLG